MLSATAAIALYLCVDAPENQRVVETVLGQFAEQMRLAAKLSIESRMLHWLAPLVLDQVTWLLGRGFTQASALPHPILTLLKDLSKCCVTTLRLVHSTDSVVLTCNLRL